MLQPNLFDIEIPNIASLKGAIVKPVLQETAKKLVVSEHYSHEMPPRAWIHYGLYAQNTLVGVTCFGGVIRASHKMIPCLTNDNQMLELVKMAIYKWHPSNTASFLLSKAVMLIKKQYPDVYLLIAYSDPIQDHLGIAYQAANWVYFGKQKEGSTVWEDDNGTQVHNRNFYGKGQPNPIKLGLKAIKLPRKHLYAYQVRENKELAWWMRIKRRKYPKRLSSNEKIPAAQAGDGSSTLTQPLQYTS